MHLRSMPAVHRHGYHVVLNIRSSKYIRSNWPGKSVAVSGWGMRFDDPASLPHLVELSKHIDYLIDVTILAARDPALRSELIHRSIALSGHSAVLKWNRRNTGPAIAGFCLPSAERGTTWSHSTRGRTRLRVVLSRPGESRDARFPHGSRARRFTDPGTPWRNICAPVEQIYRVSKPSVARCAE